MRCPRLLRTGIILGLALSACPRFLLAAEPYLAAARALYADASYEEALATLGSPPTTGEADNGQVEQHRALCLLALGRVPEAEAALARLILKQPLYLIDKSDDLSPKLIALFHVVRERTLPVAARKIYALGRQSYEAREFQQAVAHFKALSAITSHPLSLGRLHRRSKL